MRMHLRPFVVLMFGVMWLSCDGEADQTDATAEPVVLAANQFSFTEHRNRVILPVRINNSREINTILDSGMPIEGIYLFRAGMEQELALPNVREVRVPGAGDGEASQAKQFLDAKLSMGEMVFDSQMVVIAQSDFVQNFHNEGVLGQTLFGHYAVEVDWDRMVVTLHDPGTFQPDSTWEVLPLTFNEKGTAFVEAFVSVNGEDEIPVTMYLDIASGDDLELLIRENQKFALPENLEEKYLGTGLSGDIHGYEGQVASFRLGPFELANVVTAFSPAEIRSRQGDADGIIAGGTLRNFNVVYDWLGRRLCLKPNGRFNGSTTGEV